VRCSCLVIGIGLWLLLVCVQVLVSKCYKGEKPSVSLTLGQREEVKSETIPSPLSIFELAAIWVALMISESTTTQFSSTISMSEWISFRCRIVLSATNQCSLLNCVVCSELVFAVELCCLQQISVRYRIVLSVANQCSLLNYSTNNRTVSTAKLWCPNELVHWWFCVPANPFANEFALQRTSSLTSSCFSKLVR
jgi:hypothetical protein